MATSSFPPHIQFCSTETKEVRTNFELFPNYEEFTTTSPYFELDERGITRLDNADQVAYPFPTITIRFRNKNRYEGDSEMPDFRSPIKELSGGDSILFRNKDCYPKRPDFPFRREVESYTSDNGYFTYHDLAKLLLANAQQMNTAKITTIMVSCLEYDVNNGYYILSWVERRFLCIVCNRLPTIPGSLPDTKVPVVPFSST